MPEATSAWISCSPAAGSGNAIITVSVDPSSLSVGTHNATLNIISTNATNSPQVVNVALKKHDTDATTIPFGSFDTPIDGTTGITGAIPITGWGYMMLTNFLPGQGNGTYNIHAYAADKDGHTISLGTKTITCDNAKAVKPFGAIDVPGQGATKSGRFWNGGWTLTPQPNTIPTDGSTINVWVDGVKLGNPAYNQYRDDIAPLFSGYENTDGAGGSFLFDSTAYENGFIR